ncbi:MAG: trehalose-6-phosphate synthase [Blastocatellia bacterium]|nr:trehalose-6-phosphate synthase [Blastocatellia bacterium]
MIYHDDALSQSNRARLDSIAERLLSERKLIIASNRGPIEYQWNETTASWEGKRGAGGVVTAMSAVSRFVDPVWVACAMTEGDRDLAAEVGGEHIAWAQGDNKYHLRFVVPAEEEYNDYYGVISNPLLWFLQHYMWDAPRTPNITRATRQAWSNYEKVNTQIASTIRKEIDRAGDAPVVMLHDYHLYLCAGQLKKHLAREAILTHFIHIPWPEPGYWGLLPGDMRESIFRSLCACDIVGFQTSTFARNFLRTCSEFLHEAEVDIRGRTITLDGHTTYVRSYPISIDIEGLLALAESVEVREHRQRLRARCGDQTIVRIDRIEPSKNIVRGYQALDQLLDDYPEYRGRVKFLTFLVPSRLSVEEYKQYLEEIMIAAGWINTKFSDGNWQPIELFVGENYARAIAALQLYDVLLVNPVIDGMNLVAKEGAIVNENNGVIVLSEGAGAAEQLGEGSMVVSPADVIGTSESLRKALEMPLEERSRKAEWLRRTVAEEDITMWLHHQFQDIIELLIEPKQARAEESDGPKKMAASERLQQG